MAGKPLQAIEALTFLVAFAQAPDLRRLQPVQLQKLDRSVQRFINRETPAHERVDPVSVDWRELEVLRARAKPLLAGFVDDGKVAIAGDLHLSFYAIRDEDRVRLEVIGAPLDRFLYQVVRVLEAVGPDRVLKCPACGRLFVKKTKKTYCSTRCYTREYMKVYRVEQKKKKRRT